MKRSQKFVFELFMPWSPCSSSLLRCPGRLKAWKLNFLTPTFYEGMLPAAAFGSEGIVAHAPTAFPVSH